MKNKIYLICLLLVFFSLPSCKLIRSASSKAESKVLRKLSGDFIEDGSEKISKKTVRGFVGEGAQFATEKMAQKSLRELAKSDKLLAELYERFSKYISTDFADGIVVESAENGFRLYSKEFPNSAIKICGNTIFCDAGSLKGSGAVNEFLNYLLPNKTYVVDECFTYTTDKYGRVVSCSANRSKSFGKIHRNTQRNTDVQKKVVSMLDGHNGMDQSGHLFANTTGGPNELINQVPMNKDLNMHGEYRRLEKIEESALKQNKEVYSQRKLLYKGTEKRPYAIEFITKIDGRETRTVVENI